VVAVVVGCALVLCAPIAGSTLSDLCLQKTLAEYPSASSQAERQQHMAGGINGAIYATAIGLALGAAGVLVAAVGGVTMLRRRTRHAAAHRGHDLR